MTLSVEHDVDRIVENQHAKRLRQWPFGSEVVGQTL